MSFTHTYGDNFAFARHDVEVEFETLPGEAASIVRDYIRKGDHGRAEISVLGAAIQSLTVDGQKVIRKNTRSERRGGSQAAQNMHLPPILDRQTYESLTDRLLKMIVAEEWWLAKKEPFSDVFEEYLEENAGAVSSTNPTPPRRGDTTES